MYVCTYVCMRVCICLYIHTAYTDRERERGFGDMVQYIGTRAPKIISSSGLQVLEVFGFGVWGSSVGVHPLAAKAQCEIDQRPS